MSPVVVVAVLLAIAVLATWRRLARFRQALGLGHLALTGHLFLVIGYLIGLPLSPEELADLTPDLTPITALVAGWIGFSVGMAFHHRVLRMAPPGAWAAAVIPGVVTALAIGGAGCAILALAGVGGRDLLASSVVLGGVASVSAPTLARAVRDRGRDRSGPSSGMLRLVEFTAGLENALVAIFALTAFAVLRGAPDVSAVAVWLLGSVALGTVAGLCAWLFLGGEAAGDERLLLGLGMVAFTAGLAEWLGLSPEGVSAVAGLALVNLPGDRMRRLRDVMEWGERPALIVLMTLVGVYAATVLDPMVVALVGLLTLLRVGIRWVSGRVACSVSSASGAMEASPDWGLGLVSQGSFGLVMALTFFQAWQGQAAGWVLAAAALASVLNEILAPYLLARAVSASERPSPSSRGASS